MTLVKHISFLACCLLLAACDHPPTSQQAFLESYRSAYNLGNKDAVLQHVKWDGVPPESRKFYEFVLTSFIGQNQITHIEMVPFTPDPDQMVEFNGRKIKANLEPKFWLIFKTIGHAGYQGGESNSSGKFAVGIENGVYRICGMQWAVE